MGRGGGGHGANGTVLSAGSNLLENPTRHVWMLQKNIEIICFLANIHQ